MNLFVVTLWLVFLACSQEPHCLLSAPALCGLPMRKRLSTVPVYWNFVAAFAAMLRPSFAMKLYKLPELYVFDRFTATCCMYRYVVACAFINQCCICTRHVCQRVNPFGQYDRVLSTGACTGLLLKHVH